MDLEDLLQSLGLRNMFPGRIQRRNIFSVFFKNKESSKCSSCRLHDSEFVQKIVYFNGDCRNFRAGTRKRYAHPLDISTAVFLCCDFIARQDLSLHFWGCKHAFPLVVKSEQLEPPVLHIWPMKSLVAKFNAPGNGDTIQKPVLDFQMKVVSALRFEEQTVSKSNILNMIISKNGKDHSFFFHRDIEGSVKQLSEVCNGMIEACPVFDTEDSPSLYLNLRGNCKKHQDQLNFVLTSSDIIILVSNSSEINEIKSLIENKISIHKKMLIIFFSNLSDSEECITLVEELEHFCNIRSVANLIVALKGAVRFEWMTDVLSAVKSSKCKHFVKDLIEVARENYFDIDVDKIKQPIRKAESFSNKIIQHYREHSISSIFPVQGSESLEWSNADLEIYKLKHWKTDKNVRAYRDSLEKQKAQLRSKQLCLIKSHKSSITTIFLENLETSLNKIDGLDETRTCSFINSEEQNEIYLRSLKIELENATRTSQDRLYKRYSVLVSRMNVDKLHAVEIQHKLDELDLLISNTSLSISDFSREMGQIYETITSQCKSDESTNLERLTCIAVKLLLFGYQVEIMDGRSNYVPINWVKGILSELRRTLGNISIKVVSVLGIQSTGKSTLLNIMFGSQFAEGSGRCTRGAFIHLVQVSPDCSERFRAEYLLIVDTEGLFSLSSEVEDSEKVDRKDRELATFVIGLSNITIVNIMGENLSYLKDILPISVHAFLRMDLVGLNPHCILLHQNVAKGNRDQLLQQTYNLENVLDDYTAAACKLENVSRKRFKDVIQFDLAKDVYYFPPLYQSSGNQDIINPQFSEAIENLKMDIMEKTDGTATIEDFTQHIGYIWEAVKRDNFVFEFKNTIEAKVGAVIDREVCHVQWKLRSIFHENMSVFISRIADCTDIDTLLQIRSEHYEKISELTTDLLKKSYLDIYFKLPSTLIGKMLSKFKILIEDSVKRSIEEDRKMFENDFETESRKRQREIEIIEGDKKTWREIDNFIDASLNEEMVVSMDVDELSNCLFRRWMETTQFEYVKFCNTFPEEDATNSIYSSFPARHAKIKEKLEEKCIADRNMTDLLNNIPLTYWSFSDCQQEQGMANKFISDMMEFLQGMIEKLQSGMFKYGAGVYKDIVLQVRNHHSIRQGELRAKPVLEIDIALSLCGEFIQRMKQLELEHVRIATPFTKHIQNYFKSRVRESVCSQADVTEMVNNFSSTILTELSQYVVSSLSKEFADDMKNHYRFLTSKQALISHIYVTLLESDDRSFLSICLNSFELSARCCISRLFDSISGIETDSRTGPLHNVIEEYVDRNISIVCERLSENVTNQGITSNTIKQCVSMITSALGQFLPMNNIKPFENDRVEETDPDVVITRLVTNLKKESVRRNLLKTITYQVMETDVYDKIRFETVQIISSALIGCTENCPLCGEVCCIGQVNHNERHRCFMHRPIGMNGNCETSSNNLSSLTCWDVLNTNDHNTEQAFPVQQLRANWSVSSDIGTDDNSFWKFVFVTRMKEIAIRLGKEEPTYIPRSWYDLTRMAEIQKLALH